MTPSFPLRKSEIRRNLGTHLLHRYGLINCPKCHAIITVRRDQKTRRCRKCRKLFWLADNHFLPVYTSDSLNLVRRIRAGICGYLGSGKFFIPTWKFREWVRRAEEQAEVKLFLDHLPWNLQARRVESVGKTPTSGDRAEHAPGSPKSASGFLPTAQKPDLRTNLGSAPGKRG